MNKIGKRWVALLCVACLPLFCGCIKTVTGGYYNFRADQSYESGKKQEAFEFYLQAAQKGSAESQFVVSQMLLYSDGIRGNTAEGASWLEKAAAQDHMEASRALGIYLLNGDFDLPRNPGKAVYLLERAAAKGDTFSMLTLANLHLTGYGTAADPQKAAQWYRQAAQSGESVPAQWQDAQFLAKGQAARPYNQKADQKARVKRAQACLKTLGYYKGVVDGINGPGTANAVKNFQKDRNVSVTGTVDAALMRQIYQKIVYDPMKRHL